MRTEEIRVPDIGDFRDVEVVEVHVRAGDVVVREQALITVESDKATLRSRRRSQGDHEHVAACRRQGV